MTLTSREVAFLMKDGFKTPRKPRMKEYFSLAFAVALLLVIVLFFFWGNLVSLGDTGRWSTEYRSAEAGPYRVEYLRDEDGVNFVHVIDRDGEQVTEDSDAPTAEKAADALNREAAVKLAVALERGRAAKAAPGAPSGSKGTVKP